MALIPPFFIDCVVAIGTYDEKKEPRWLASGFLYGYRVGTKPEGQGLYRVYMVTNRHVLSGLNEACVRMNPEADEPARVYGVQLLDKKGNPRWLTSERAEVDVAAFPVKFKLLKKQLIQVSFFANDLHTASIADMNDLGVCEGDIAYVLGFPMALVGERRNLVIVRGGTIARIRDTLANVNPEFLVDAFVFPGNSGGPVISAPQSDAIKGTKTQNAANLIGVVKSYVPYRDVAVSQQTGNVRVIFEENSGLTAAHPMDYVDEIIQRDIERGKAVAGEQRTPEGKSPTDVPDATMQA